MRSINLIALLAATATLGVAATAEAETYCVGSPAACPAGASSLPDLQAALSAAQNAPGPDEVLLGSGTFTTATGFTYFGDASNPLDLVGEGDTSVLQADTAAKSGSFEVAKLFGPATAVRKVKIVAPDSTTVQAKPTGLAIQGGVVEDVLVTDSGTAGLGAERGVLTHGGEIRDSRIHMNANADGVDVGSTAPVLVEDASVRAERAIIAVAGGNVTVRRAAIRARTIGAFVRGGAMTVDSSSIHITGSNASGLKAQGYLAGSPQTTLDASHVTVVADGQADTRGATVLTAEDGDATIRIDNSIVHGFANGVQRASSDPGGQGEAKAELANVDYVASNDLQLGPGGPISAVDISSHGPAFADAAAEDYRLVVGSPLIDAGRVASFAPLGDLDIAGDERTFGPGRDLGAHEYNGTPPVATITGQLVVAEDQPLTLYAWDTTDVDLDVNAYDWSFGDGTTGSGSALTHSWAEPGTYKVTLTVSDEAGHTDEATADVTVTAAPAPPVEPDQPKQPEQPEEPNGGGRTVTTSGTGGNGSGGSGGSTDAPDTVAPAITSLVRRGLLLRLSLSEAAEVVVQVQKRGKSKRFRSTGAARRVAANAGANSLRLRKLTKGRYRVVVTATDAAGNRAVKRLAFRVTR